MFKNKGIITITAPLHKQDIPLYSLVEIGQRKEDMNILEELRERKKTIEFRCKTSEYPGLLSQYDLALENALLKLKNRGVEIKDLKFRLDELQALTKNTEKFLVSTFGSDELGFIQRQVEGLRQKSIDLEAMNKHFSKEVEKINKQHGY